MNEKKFAETWGNQTDIGRHYGISAIALGRLLIGADLRDPVTKFATEKALGTGYAKSTPLRDGTPFFVWNREKVGSLVAAAGRTKVPEHDYHVKKVLDGYRSCLGSTGDDELDSVVSGCLAEMLDDLLDDVPSGLRVRVRKDVHGRLAALGLMAEGMSEHAGDSSPEP